MKATAIANSNIAFVKYWGKKDEFSNLPMNPSISMTLDENLSTKTTVEFSDKYEEDVLILNSEKYSDSKLVRVSNFLDKMRKLSGVIYHAKVVSENSFPTGTGIASSASGFAALAAASSKALGLNLSDKELSGLARQGSGSACRSVYGGFVVWDDEFSIQFKDELFWPELRDILVIVDKDEKKISSRDAMKHTVQTSSLYKKRLQALLDIIRRVKAAIGSKDFQSLAHEIMNESDSLHACIKDTVPKVEYLNEASYRIIELVKKLNSVSTIAAYTFDAGPNAHIITLEQYVPGIKKEMLKLFGVQLIESRPGRGIRYSEEHLL
ncbi:MAG: diphosphomevalonate decarboxylase [Candidatus Woesearchaeota archaeon]|nr:diphosphomevalonate decarboxylase [Candidatus Woesearchaeota archaeon]